MTTGNKFNLNAYQDKTFKLNENVWAQLVDHIPAGIVIMDTNSKIRFMNYVAQRQLLLHSNESIDLYKDKKFYHMDGITEFRQNELPFYRSLNYGEEVTGVELLIKLKDGRNFYSWESSAPIKDSNQQIIGAVLVFLNITEMKEMENELLKYKTELEGIIVERTRELQNANLKLLNMVKNHEKIQKVLVQNKKKYQNLLNSTMDLIFVHRINEDGSSGKFIEVNDTACKVLGYTRQELMNMTPRDISKNCTFSSDKISNHKKRVHNRLYIFETEYHTKDGRRIPMDVRSRLINWNNEKVDFEIASDITERKMMEKEIAQLERLKLVSQMSAGIAHEIRNPLTTVRGFLQLMQKNGQVKKEYIDIAIEEIDRANGIITEFLSIAKDKTSELKEIGLNTVVANLLPLLEADAASGSHVLEVTLQSNSKLLLDEKEIRQLILNLVRNGFEAMINGGKLTIKTYQKKKTVILEVTDQGTGIDENIKDKLGTPFITTKESGTGLGLAVCFGIAQRHNATIKIDSSNKGTSVLVCFNQAST